MNAKSQSTSQQRLTPACGLGKVLAAFALIVTVCSIVASSAAFATPVIGSASTVVRDVRGLLEQAWRVVVIDDNVHQDEVIKTGRGSAARLIFADRTDFMIGGDSEVILDKFIYDPSSNSGQLILRATKGLMKFRTGSMSSRSYRIDTPVATVGVRGTEFVIHVFESGATSIKVISGEVVVRDHRQKSLSVKPGETALVFPDSDARAAGGPALVAEGDFVLNDETREMISQIVFSESASQTQLAANGKQTASFFISGNAVSPNGNPGVGNPIAGRRSIRTATPRATRVMPYWMEPLPNPLPFIVPTGLPGAFFNGGFDSGLDGWTFRGGGSAAVIPHPADPLNNVLQLTTGSPISFEQAFKPPGFPFSITFKRQFLGNKGALCVFVEEAPGGDDGSSEQAGNGEVAKLCDENPLERFISTGSDAAMVTETVDITDAALYTLNELVLIVVFDADIGGVRVFLDDLAIAPYVEGEPGPAEVPLMPAAAFLIAGMGALAFAARRRRKPPLH